VEGTEATGSPVEKQDASAGELWATYRALDAELVSAPTDEAVRTWSEAHEAATAAYAAWRVTTQLG
jgi:hypothetical protein